MKKLILLQVAILSQIVVFGQNPLPNAHAHNDYEHKRPLLDALENGFTSVEADVWLIGTELYVYHDKPTNPRSDRTLQNLYLEPLSKIIEEKGNVYPEYDHPVYLMIDFKSDAEPTYQKLRSVLMDYENLLNAGVVIFISGNRPIEMITQDEAKWAALDGRPDDLGKGISPKLMPVVSTSFRKVSKWNGKEEISKSDQQAIKILVEQTHAEGKLVRFWATPDNPNAWKQLQALGVDLINTDDLNGLSKFLSAQ